MTDTDRPAGPTRRRFLTGVGLAGAGAVVSTVAAGPASAVAEAAAPQNQPTGAPSNPNFFGRLFPKLPPFAPANDTVRAALLEVGKPGGISDAKDDLAADPAALILDPAKNGNPTGAGDYGTNPDNPTMTAGSTFVGQFTDHDITFDRTSQLGAPQNPLSSPNARTAALDLDSVFGGGPRSRPDLYVTNSNASVGPKLKIGSGGVYEDVPRVANGDGTYRALLGDPRNDENVLIAGMHCAHILFYNRVVDALKKIDLRQFPVARGVNLSDPYQAFLVARQVTLWHYQWLLVNEHLPQIVGQAAVDDVLSRGNRFYRPPAGDAFLPIEFGAAAYRFGHSMVRPSYRANFTSGTGDSSNPAKKPFFGLVFDATNESSSGPVKSDRNDLLGGFPAPRRYVGWQTFFDFGDGQVKNNKKIDPLISSVLFTLPVPALAPVPNPQTTPLALPQRNLLRQLTWGLPSGQAIADAMGVSRLSASDLADIGAIYSPFAVNTPLWYYLVAEAKVMAGGLHLGPVGGRIVAETLIGLLRADASSYLSVLPGFRPFLGTDLPMGPNPNPNIAGDRSYTRAHFLYYAGVVTPGTYR